MHVICGLLCKNLLKDDADDSNDIDADDDSDNDAADNNDIDADDGSDNDDECDDGDQWFYSAALVSISVSPMLIWEESCVLHKR